MSWAKDATAALKTMLLVSEKFDAQARRQKAIEDTLREVVKDLAALQIAHARLEAKFELMVDIATAGGVKRLPPR
jgi:hypothetical protein